ncbi:MAG: hypothetical protein WC728_11300 [Elusimicrobiota bacterium]
MLAALIILAPIGLTRAEERTDPKKPAAEQEREVLDSFLKRHLEEAQPPSEKLGFLKEQGLLKYARVWEGEPERLAVDVGLGRDGARAFLVYDPSQDSLRAIVSPPGGDGRLFSVPVGFDAASSFHQTLRATLGAPLPDGALPVSSAERAWLASAAEDFTARRVSEDADGIRVGSAVREIGTKAFFNAADAASSKIFAAGNAAIDAAVDATALVKAGQAKRDAAQGLDKLASRAGPLRDALQGAADKGIDAVAKQQADAAKQKLHAEWADRFNKAQDKIWGGLVDYLEKRAGGDLLNPKPFSDSAIHQNASVRGMLGAPEGTDRALEARRTAENKQVWSPTNPLKDAYVRGEDGQPRRLSSLDSKSGTFIEPGTGKLYRLGSAGGKPEQVGRILAYGSGTTAAVPVIQSAPGRPEQSADGRPDPQARVIVGLQGGRQSSIPRDRIDLRIQYAADEKGRDIGLLRLGSYVEKKAWLNEKTYWKFEGDGTHVDPRTGQYYRVETTYREVPADPSERTDALDFGGDLLPGVRHEEVRRAILIR